MDINNSNNNNNVFILIDFSNFIYGFTIYGINKNNLKTEFKAIIKPKYEENIDEALERTMNEYNINDFIFKDNKFNKTKLAENLQNKGYNLFNYKNIKVEE